MSSALLFKLSRNGQIRFCGFRGSSRSFGHFSGKPVRLFNVQPVPVKEGFQDTVGQPCKPGKQFSQPI